MKTNLIKIIKILGLGITEFVIDIELSFETFNSIEWDPDENKIFLNIFEDDGMQQSYDFDDLLINDQVEVFLVLSSIAYN
jgi:hypothetical protein